MVVKEALLLKLTVGAADLTGLWIFSWFIDGATSFLEFLLVNKLSKFRLILPIPDQVDPT